MGEVQQGGLFVERKKDFDLAVVKTHFSNTIMCSPTNGQGQSLTDPLMGPTQSINHELSIDQYLKAFVELTRFFRLTGPVLSFVANDLSGKISTLQQHLDSAENGHHYQSLSSMITYEMSVGRVTQKGSGTRTLLRLHWALEFIVEFMDKLRTTPDDAKTSSIVMEIYQRTLALHHPWLTRQLASLAVYTLPSIKNLIVIMCRQNFEEVKTLLGEIVEDGQVILEHTSCQYSLHNLNHIP